jgi:hypothetical protein
MSPPTTAQSLGALLKSARDIMRKDKGLNGDLDRLPMLTWIMFLKFLDDLEIQREGEAKLVTPRKSTPHPDPLPGRGGEPALQAVDYFLWALQRAFEKREDRYLELLWPQCSLVVDVDDTRAAEYGTYYTRQKPLTAAALKSG